MCANREREAKVKFGSLQGKTGNRKLLIRKKKRRVIEAERPIDNVLTRMTWIWKYSALCLWWIHKLFCTFWRLQKVLKGEREWLVDGLINWRGFSITRCPVSCISSVCSTAASVSRDQTVCWWLCDDLTRLSVNCHYRFHDWSLLAIQIDIARAISWW